MVRAVASRVALRPRVSKAEAREAAAEAARIKELAILADAPTSVGRVPTRAGDNFKTANVGVRPMGNSRRIFLLHPHLEAAELEGLAHRIHALSNNEFINSVLIASDDNDDSETNCLPRFVTDLDNPRYGGLNMDFDPAPDSTWHVSGGYDPLKLAEALSANGGSLDKPKYLLDSLRKLALATKGEDSPGEKSTRVPIITMPHGIVTDAGYAFCMGGYVLATRQTSFRILNPSRGLSFDPVGFSYIFHRLGWNDHQRSSKYPGCGFLLALAGYEADCFDMVETGLATHLFDDSATLQLLEFNLASIAPWNQQGLVQKPRRGYGQVHSFDPNAQFRNKTIAHVIEQLSDHSSNSKNSLPYDFSAKSSDPALDTDHVPWDSGFFSSDLVDTAAHFDSIFKQEKTVEGIMERLREASNKKSDDIEEQENSQIAKEIVTQMERQSPLSLRVIHQLMILGGQTKASLESCMEREMKVQLNMIQQSDFKEWAAHVNKHGGDETKAPPFGGWKHKSVAEVSQAEVDAILSDQS